MKRKFLMALGVLALIATPVLAGLWPNFPIVGGAAYCSSTNTAGVPGTAAVCTTTTQAGPTIVTGLETVPADTNLTQGRQPQTVRLTLASFNALPLAYSTGSSSANNTIVTSAVDGGVIIVGSAALSPVTLTLPPSPIDGQQFRLSSTQNAASLTVQGAGSATVSNAPTAITTSTTGAYGYLFRYRASNTTWYRLQ